jgi:two-component system, sensor histidine kinase PdtaS
VAVTVHDPASTGDHSGDPVLQRLVASWGLLADLSFSDLLLFLASGPATANGAPQQFVVAAQVRPTTGQTLYQSDLVGDMVSAQRRPLLGDAWVSGEIREGHTYALGTAQAARVECIPVQRNGQVIAVVTREWALDTARRPGRLERTYLELFDRLAHMVANGSFPFEVDDESQETQRVGDGVIVLDADRRVTFASPNAVSALHRMGTYLNAEGRSLPELGLGALQADRLFGRGVGGRASVPVFAEVERNEARVGLLATGGTRVVVSLRAIPLLSDASVTGALVLLRDVSDVRRRDRLLSTKDAQVREVHHRVKNNLQTISALLRLQGRRLASTEAKQAIEESVRRIRSIALVHETLSRDASEAVPFGEIVRPLVRMVEDGLGSTDRPIAFRVEGDAGDVPAEVATPLAVVLTELLQNAVEHGFRELPAGGSGNVTVTLTNDIVSLRVVVADDGVGLPPNFSPANDSSLGLTIVRSLVAGELGGAIAFHNSVRGGAVVDLKVPIHANTSDVRRVVPGATP